MKRALLVPLGMLIGCQTENELSGGEYLDPRLELADPAAAAWMSAGAHLARGTASNLSTVTVNGNEALVEDGSFAAEMELARGLNVIEASGVDMRGDTLYVRHGVLAGDFADPGHAIEDAVNVRVNEGGLNYLLGIVAGMIHSDEIATTVTAGGPVYEDCYSLLGWEAVTVEANITELYFGTLELGAQPRTDRLTVNAEIPDLWVGVNVSGEIGWWDFSEDIWVWADVVAISGDVTADVVDGVLDIGLPAAIVDLQGFGYDTSLLPGDIETYILVDTIASFLEGTLADMMVEKVPPLLDEQLAGLDLSTDTEVLEKPLSIAAEIASASIDDDGLAVGIDLDVYMPSSGSKTYAGYLTAADGEAHTDPSSDVAVSLSDDLLNRILFEAWRADILNMTMSTEDGSLDPSMMHMLHAEEGTIRIDGKLPPVIVEHDGKLQAQLGELDVQLETPGGGMGNYLDAVAFVYVDLELEVDDGVLHLSVGEPRLELMVRDSDWGADNDTITSLMTEMLPLDSFLSLLSDIEIPLPALGPVTITEASVERENSGVFTGVSIDFGPVDCW